MANFHSDEWIMEQIERHYQEALKLFPEEQIFGVFLYGSQNYGIDYEGSDVDTKCVIFPSKNDIINNQALFIPYTLANIEHLEIIDIRLYFQHLIELQHTYIETLFTQYYYINPIYAKFFNILRSHREQIVFYDKVLLIKNYKAEAIASLHFLEKPLPNRETIIATFGYDYKRFVHLLRMQELIHKNIMPTSIYAENLLCDNASLFQQLKMQTPNNILYNHKEVKEKSIQIFSDIITTADQFVASHYNVSINNEIIGLLGQIKTEIMQIYLRTLKF